MTGLAAWPRLRLIIAASDERTRPPKELDPGPRTAPQGRPPLFGARSRVPPYTPPPDSPPGAAIAVNCADAGDGADADPITARPIIVKIS